jgi:hypothetical protein
MGRIFGFFFDQNHSGFFKNPDGAFELIRLCLAAFLIGNEKRLTFSHSNRAGGISRRAQKSFRKPAAAAYQTWPQIKDIIRPNREYIFGPFFSRIV